MPTQDGDFVTAEGLAKTLGEVGGGSSPLDSWPVGSLMLFNRSNNPSVYVGGQWRSCGYGYIGDVNVYVYQRIS